MKKFTKCLLFFLIAFAVMSAAGMYKTYASPDDPVEYISWDAILSDGGYEWDYSGPYTYDGTYWGVYLRMEDWFMEEVSVRCYGNSEIEAGDYTAVAVLSSPLAEGTYTLYCSWEIQKATYDMSNVKWDYPETPFPYDGTEKAVKLTGLPDGVTAEYTGNTASASGKYTASAALKYDTKNYKPISVNPLTWEIAKGSIDISGVSWDYSGAYTYDGKEKKIVLKGLPAGVTASYSGNTATSAGKYKASATLSFDKDNYEPVSVNPLNWEIKKAKLDMSKVKWDYPETSFTYDGTEKTVKLTGLPKGVTADYSGNTETKSGEYKAVASLKYDSDNYETVTVDALEWKIGKAAYDMSGVSWDYSGTPFIWDGTEKSVSLTGLPEGVIVTEIKNGKKVKPGTYTAEAVLSWDTENYEKPHIDPLSYTIEKATYDLSKARWDYYGPIEATGKEITVTFSGLPDGVNVSLKGENKATLPGNYECSAILSWTDKQHYNMPELPSSFNALYIHNEANKSTLFWSIISKIVKVTDNTTFKNDIVDLTTYKKIKMVLVYDEKTKNWKDKNQGNNTNQNMNDSVIIQEYSNVNEKIFIAEDVEKIKGIFNGNSNYIFSGISKLTVERRREDGHRDGKVIVESHDKTGGIILFKPSSTDF